MMYLYICFAVFAVTNSPLYRNDPCSMLFCLARALIHTLAPVPQPPWVAISFRPHISSYSTIRPVHFPLISLVSSHSLSLSLSLAHTPMQSLKRKTPPAWVSSPSPSLAGPSGTRASPVKVEDGEDVKRRRAGATGLAITLSPVSQFRLLSPSSTPCPFNLISATLLPNLHDSAASDIVSASLLPLDEMIPIPGFVWS
jgi:hypothetical protein